MMANNDIYDTTKQQEKDAKIQTFLNDLAKKTQDDFIQSVADRFNELSTAAHDRKHWKGSEK